MEKELDKLYNNIREESLALIKEKNIDLEELMNKLDVTFYLQTFSLLEHWEG